MASRTWGMARTCVVVAWLCVLVLGEAAEPGSCGGLKKAYKANGCCGAPAAKPLPRTVLRCGINYGAASNEAQIIPFMNRHLAKLTDGALQLSINVTEPLYGAAFGKVESGEIDCAVTLIKDIPDVPAAAVLAGGLAGAGYGLDQGTIFRWMLTDPAASGLLERMYEDKGYLGVVAALVGPEILGWCQRPVPTVEDWINQTFRVPAGLVGEAFTKLMGENAKVLNPYDTIQAVKAGSVDCFEWNSPYADVGIFGQFDVDLRDSPYKHLYLGTLHQNTMIGSLIFSRPVLASLSASQRAAINTAGELTALEMQAARSAGNAELVNQMAEGQNGWNITFHNTPAGLAGAFKGKVLEVIAARVADGDSLMEDTAAKLKELAAKSRIYRSYELQGEADLWN